MRHQFRPNLVTEIQHLAFQGANLYSQWSQYYHSFYSLKHSLESSIFWVNIKILHISIKLKVRGKRRTWPLESNTPDVPSYHQKYVHVWRNTPAQTSLQP